MAVKIFCDGCDRETSATMVNRVSVELHHRNTSKSTVPYDLCDGCMSALQRRHLPSSWERVAPAA